MASTRSEAKLHVGRALRTGVTARTVGIEVTVTVTVTIPVTVPVTVTVSIPIPIPITVTVTGVVADTVAGIVAVTVGAPLFTTRAGCSLGTAGDRQQDDGREQSTDPDNGHGPIVALDALVRPNDEPDRVYRFSGGDGPLEVVSPRARSRSSPCRPSGRRLRNRAATGRIAPRRGPRTRTLRHPRRTR